MFFQVHRKTHNWIKYEKQNKVQNFGIRFTLKHMKFFPIDYVTILLYLFF